MLGGIRPRVTPSVSLYTYRRSLNVPHDPSRIDRAPSVRMLVVWLAASSGLLSPPLLRVIGQAQGPAQRAVVARATTPCALPTWFNSDWVDERLEAFAPLVGKEGFAETSTSIVDAGARLSVSVLLGPWVVAAGPLARVRLVSALLLVGATPFLLHLIERISFYPRSWIRDMLRGNWPWRWRARCRRAPLRPPLCARPSAPLPLCAPSPLPPPRPHPGSNNKRATLPGTYA